ncbi:MAG: hypothetical protein ACYTFI_06550 [Planctomycetota bacterium]|jgi:hypothetical protein
MKAVISVPLLSAVLLGISSSSRPADAAVRIGTGNAGLLGGDLTDPEDDVVDDRDYGQSWSEEKLRPEKGNWRTMKSAPTSPSWTPPHQRHAYQSWQGAPACAVFLNRPQNRKWYVGFKDGGNGGPTDVGPYYVAVELAKPVVLTHFTITTSPDMPGRDPKTWAIQGSNSGEEGDWVDIYRCDAADRGGSPLQVNPRCETILFTAFTSTDLTKIASPADAKKVASRLQGRKIEKADFRRPSGAYPWYRIAVYSCFNPNTSVVANPALPPGFSLGQVEFFGVPGKAARGPEPARPVGKEPAPSPFDPAFIISYWCGPPRKETTVARYREVADCGFNVAYAAIDHLWKPASKASDEHIRKFLDVCRQTGLKALVWDGRIPGDKWKPPKPEEVPQIKKTLDEMIARWSSHPAFLGFILGDEHLMDSHPRLGVVTQYLLKKDPKHLPYYNLLPNYAFKSNSEYEGLVVDYITRVKPALVSWDHYRQMFESGDERYYWYNLDIMRRQCLKANVPFNQIICSIKHMGYRECSEADLRWQVWTSLAYGSRGIQYFTYCHVPGMAWGDAPALLTKDLRRDVKWEYVKKINHRIAKLGPTLVRLTSTGVYHTEPLPPGGRRLGHGAPVKTIDGGPTVVGCFVDRGGREFILPVNRSFRKKFAARLTLDGRIVSAAEVSQETGRALKPVTLRGGVLEVPLEPGEGRLFLLKSLSAPPRSFTETEGLAEAEALARRGDILKARAKYLEAAKDLAEGEDTARARIELRIAGLAERGRLRQIVRRGLESKGPRGVSIAFGGRRERARLVRADDTGVALRVKGMETSMGWGRMGPRDLAGFASAYAASASEHLAVAKYLLACGEKGAAAKALSRVSRAGLSEAEREVVKLLGGAAKP